MMEIFKVFTLDMVFHSVLPRRTLTSLFRKAVLHHGMEGLHGSPPRQGSRARSGARVRDGGVQGSVPGQGSTALRGAVQLWPIDE